ncbi:MAG TPA: type II toxin-antitoxin system VapC family toxin [Xanthobacteraceae bacterium]
MIAVDTSALMAIILGEPEADACIEALESEADVLISAGTVAEAMIVATGRNVAAEMTNLIDRFGFNIVTVTAASARRAAEAYELWGKGINPAALNFGNCFAYEIAKENSCGLLFVGENFSKTDLQRVL